MVKKCQNLSWNLQIALHFPAEWDTTGRVWKARDGRETIKWIGVIQFILVAQKVQTAMKTCRHQDTHTHTDSIWALKEYVSQTQGNENKASGCVHDCHAIYMCVMRWMFPRGRLPGRRPSFPVMEQGENSPQQEPGTTNQCQWMSQGDVMTWAAPPWRVGGFTVMCFPIH